MAYNMLILVLMTLTLMQSDSGSEKANIQCSIILTTKQATSIKLATTEEAIFYLTLTLQTFTWLEHLGLKKILFAWYHLAQDVPEATSP